MSAEAVEVDHSHKAGEHIAHDEAHKNRERAQETLGKHLAKQAGKKRYGTHNPVVHAAEVGRTHTSCKRVGSDGQEREADSRNDGSRNDMRDELDPVLDEESEQSLNKTADDDGTYKRAHTVCSGNADGKREERERDAHHDR